MRWKKVIPVVFFGIFLVSQLVTSPIYAQEKVYDVIIVGGGISGLSAGQKLMKEKYDVLILEARDVGGRIVTDRSFDGYPLDYGASWIHDYDAKDNPIRDLAEQHKDIQAIYTTYGSNATYDSSGKLIEHGKERHIAMQKMWEKFEQKMISECDLRQKSYEELTAEDDFSVEKVTNMIIDENELKGTDKEDFLFYVNWFIEQDNGADAKDISFWTWFEDNEDETAPDCKDLIFHHEVKERIVLGYEQIVDILKKDLEIKTKTIVTKIDYTDTPVKVFTSDGSIYLAKRVINTVPLGVLKSSIDGIRDAGDIEFVPKLPQDKLDAIKNLEMGLLNKSFFIFSKDNVLWERTPAVDWILHVPGEGEEGRWVIFINMYHISKGDVPILLGLNSGSAGKELENDIESSLQGQDVTGSKVQEEGMKVLRKIFGSDIEDPVLVKMSTKLNNPFLRGSYLYMPVGGDYYHENLGGPVIPEDTSLYDAKLFFAGEATYTKGDWGTTHAAYITGVNEADCIIFLDNGWQPGEKQMKNCRITPEQVVPKSKELKSEESSLESTTSDILYLDGNNGKIPVDLASFYAELISAIFFGITTWLLIKDYFGGEYETKMQVRQMRDDSYGRIRDHHHDLIRLQIEQPELMEIFKEIKKPVEYEGKRLDEIKLNPLQMQIFNFYLAEFDLYERVYLLLEDPSFEKVDAVEWITWLIYLEQISHHWLFEYTYEKTYDLFYEKMMAAVKNDIIGIKPYAKNHLTNLRIKENIVNKEKENEEKKPKEVSPISESTKESITEIYKQVIREDYIPSKEALECYGYLLEKRLMSEEEIRNEIKEIKTKIS